MEVSAEGFEEEGEEEHLGVEVEVILLSDTNH